MARHDSFGKFQPPAFSIHNEITTGRSYLIGPPLGSEDVVSASATFFGKYLTSGEYLTSARVKWSVASSPTRFTPPSWPTFSFGNSSVRKYEWERVDCPPMNSKSVVSQYEGYTNAVGQHSIGKPMWVAISLFVVDIKISGRLTTPLLIEAEAIVTDLENQQLSSKSDFIVHPSELCVGLRFEKEFVHADVPVCLIICVCFSLYPTCCLTNCRK